MFINIVILNNYTQIEDLSYLIISYIDHEKTSNFYKDVFDMICNDFPEIKLKPSLFQKPFARIGKWFYIHGFDQFEIVDFLTTKVHDYSFLRVSRCLIYSGYY